MEWRNVLVAAVDLEVRQVEAQVVQAGRVAQAGRVDTSQEKDLHAEASIVRRRPGIVRRRRLGHAPTFYRQRCVSAIVP